MATVLIDSSAVLAFDSARSLVTDAGGLNIAVERFAFQDAGEVIVFNGTDSFALAASSLNYVYADIVTEDIASSTSGYPPDAVRLARVLTSGGAVETIIADRAVFGVKPGYVTNLPLNSVLPSAPPSGFLALYGRLRHTRPYLEVQGPAGRDESLQPFLGLNRVVMHLPENGTTIRTWGIPNTNVGTISHPTLASSSFANSIRRWRNTSAGTANSAAENRCNQTTVWRGNAAGLGGFTFITRVSLATLTANCRGFFGLTSATGAISTTQVPSNLTNCIGFGWDSGETTLRFQHNDGSGAATRVDLGASFPTNNTAAVYTMFVYSARNGSEIAYRIVREDTGDVADGAVSTNIPSNTTFLTHHLHMNNGGDAAAVAFDCSGIYVESDF